MQVLAETLTGHTIMLYERRREPLIDMDKKNSTEGTCCCTRPPPSTTTLETPEILQVSVYV